MMEQDSYLNTVFNMYIFRIHNEKPDNVRIMYIDSPIELLRPQLMFK